MCYYIDFLGNPVLAAAKEELSAAVLSLADTLLAIPGGDDNNQLAVEQVRKEIIITRRMPRIINEWTWVCLYIYHETLPYGLISVWGVGMDQRDVGSDEND